MFTNFFLIPYKNCKNKFFFTVSTCQQHQVDNCHCYCHPVQCSAVTVTCHELPQCVGSRPNSSTEHSLFVLYYFASFIFYFTVSSVFSLHSPICNCNCFIILPDFVMFVFVFVFISSLSLRHCRILAAISVLCCQRHCFVCC